MWEELFVGIVSASGQQYGVCACIDPAGRDVGFTRFSWSPKGLVTLLERVRHEAAEVIVGVEAGGWDPDMALALVRSPVAAKLAHEGAIDVLLARVRHKRNALRARATSLALLLLLTDYPIKPVHPEHLARSRVKAERFGWQVACQQRLMARLQTSTALAARSVR
jgi:hypothetical protein